MVARMLSTILTKRKSANVRMRLRQHRWRRARFEEPDQHLAIEVTRFLDATIELPSEKVPAPPSPKLNVDSWSSTPLRQSSHVFALSRAS
jgi:hypothetical protein